MSHSRTTINSTTRQAGDIINWSAVSPDLNPIENVWSLLKDRVARRKPLTQEDLQFSIREEWQNLDNQEVISLAESMSQRVRMVIESESDYVGH